ncbi:hypothetical protein CBS101457_006053 [Exobasidium rhododendri]|nr:hypothetical protein CBS101457_006053 [Exobasidium rhododendri]
MTRASTSRPEDVRTPTSHHSHSPAPQRQRTAEDERARAAAKQAEKEMWEKTRGAGSSVFKLADSGKIKKSDSSEWKAEDVLPTLAEVEKKLYDIVEVPSIDVLLSRGICDYTLLPKTLGRGKFSTVFIASKNGELSAIKHTALFPHHQLISTRLLREPTLLAELPPHPNLVAVKETIRTPGHFYLVEEYLGGYVTLEALLPMLSDSQPPILPTSAAESILAQLLSAVHSIHVPLQICHRDIKPENILVHPDTLQLKLLDFGLATHYSKSEPKLSTCCGSPAFHCPEIVKALASPPGSVMYMGPEVDAWTCGVTMLRCLTGLRFPLGASHSSLRGMAIRAQRAVATIEDEDLRRKVGALLDMDSVKRMKKFEELVAEQKKKEVGEVPKEVKKFKSTTFIPVEPTYSIKLPLLAPHLVNNDAFALNANGSDTPCGPASLSRRTTPASSRPPSPNRSPLHTPIPPQSNNAVTNIVALNPTNQPPERVLSYIKYCLRCAGILYHTWPDSSLNSKSRSNSPVNYFTNHPVDAVTRLAPVSSSSSSSHSEATSNAGFAEAIARNYGQAHNQSLASPPITPLFPPSHTMEDRTDGFAHVQIFQCVIEVVDEEEQKDGGEEQMSLVQSIMAAFGRKKPAPPPPSPVKRSDFKRSLSTPAKARAKEARDTAVAPGTPAGTRAQPSSSSKDKTSAVECLTFHLIVRFPNVASHPPAGATARLTPSRHNSSINLSHQVATTNFYNNGRHSLAPSNTSSEKLTGNEGLGGPANGGSEVKGKRVSLEVPQAMLHGVIKPVDAETTATPNLEIDTNLPLNSHHLQQFFPQRSTDRSPSTSRAPSRSRKKSSRGTSRKPRVFIQVTDQRALQIVRDALRVGGTIDTQEMEDYFSTNHHRHSLPPNADHLGSAGTTTIPLSEVSEPLTPARGDQRRKNRSRASTSVSRMANVYNSDLLTSKHSEDDQFGTPRSSRFPVNEKEGGSEAVDERRGRQLNARGMVASTLGVQAPSQLSTVALKEESPNNDALQQSIDSLNIILQSILTPSSTNNDVSSTTSPGTPSSADQSTGPVNSIMSTNNSSSSLLSALTPYHGGETRVQMQIRTILMEISQHLKAAEKIGVNALEDLITPLSFNLFSALSPALGLECQETNGLPTTTGTTSTSVGETVTLRGLAKAALDIVARSASPREMFLAAQERLEVLSTTQDLRSTSAAGIEEGEEEEEEGDGEGGVEEAQEGDSNKEKIRVASGLPSSQTSSPPAATVTVDLNGNWSSGLEVAGLLHFLGVVIPRIKTQKPHNFIQPLAGLLPRSIQALLRKQMQVASRQYSLSDVMSPSGSTPQASSIDGDTTAAKKKKDKVAASKVTNSLFELIRNIKIWIDAVGDSKEHSEKANTSLCTLLFACVIVLMPELPKVDGFATLSDYQFKAFFPQYAFRPPTRQGSCSSSSPQDLQAQNQSLDPHSTQVWTGFQEMIDFLKIDLEKLAFQRSGMNSVLQEDAGSIAITTMGAFILHVNLLCRQMKTSRSPLKWTPGESHDKLKNAMPLLLASLGAGPPATISLNGKYSLGGSTYLGDAALLWILWCCQGLNKENGHSVVLKETEIISLIQLLSSHAASSPDPSSRLISLTLVELLLEKNVEEGLGRELLRDLIVESPFPQLKSASVGLAKRLIATDFIKTTNRYANRSFLSSIFTTVITLPLLPSQESVKDMHASKAYLDDNGAWLSECLGFTYFVAARDKNNQTGLLDLPHVTTIQSTFLFPLENWLRQLSSLPSSPSAKESSELVLQSSVLTVALDRAKKAIDLRREAAV